MYDDEIRERHKKHTKKKGLKERKEEEEERHRINWNQDEGGKDFSGSSLAWHTSYFTTLCWT
ncbi:uncharacterized protein EAF02_003074 [Botrytis sinoallii]|uniref:uncharacterized protein n=1 Tax=Botrytis sinoallii TaxID=1463999 RepID=UPI00190079C5|nr:uncharacterized protein EAF02_003074 [Botrytis sinoallii]KAF7888533.1 hypothetical protein EAF02_003074 [Botrytis sinoallii]